jgi:hypothetical protein
LLWLCAFSRANWRNEARQQLNRAGFKFVWTIRNALLNVIRKPSFLCFPSVLEKEHRWSMSTGWVAGAVLGIRPLRAIVGGSRQQSISGDPTKAIISARGNHSSNTDRATSPSTHACDQRDRPPEYADRGIGENRRAASSDSGRTGSGQGREAAAVSTPRPTRAERDRVMEREAGGCVSRHQFGLRPTLETIPAKRTPVFEGRSSRTQPEDLEEWLNSARKTQAGLR